VAESKRLIDILRDGSEPTEPNPHQGSTKPSMNPEQYCPICERNLNQFLKVRSYEFGLKKAEWDWKNDCFKQDSVYMKLDNLCTSDYELLRTLRKELPDSLPRILIEHAIAYRKSHPLRDSDFTREDKIQMKLGQFRRRQARAGSSGPIESYLNSLQEKK
jgi:hypothetical protein